MTKEQGGLNAVRIGKIRNTYSEKLKGIYAFLVLCVDGNLM
jgi:hypothetical protein